MNLDGQTLVSRIPDAKCDGLPDGITTTVSVNKDTTGAIIGTATQISNLEGQTDSVSDGRKPATTYDNFTAAGQGRKTTHSDGTYTVTTLDTAARPTKVETRDSSGTLIATVHTTYHPDGSVAATWGTNTSLTYGYSATSGRLQTVTDDSSASFTYGYLANSSLIHTVAASNRAIHTVTNKWEPTRDVLDLKENRVGITDVSTYDYTVNPLGQRTNVATGGSAFPATPTWLWGYDPLGQVISADSSVNTSERAYQYDAIGNRIEARDGVTAVTGTPNYSSNGVNQYTAVGALEPEYDFDGNATAYPLPTAPNANSVLGWDAENRLLEVQVAGSGPLVQTLYDAQSRRISETVGSITTLYVYDGWNCIAEYTGATLSKTRLWGLDLSGSFQGAGGVGGMLSETQITASPAASNSYFPTYDGNGNVSEYLDFSGNPIAHFEYDPFGHTVANTDASNQFAYRFSTKPLNFATGFYYYGYRWYDPQTGRWPSRDPIQERGGINLFGFVGNNGVGRFDLLGLDVSTKQAEDSFEIKDPGYGSLGLTEVVGNAQYEIKSENSKCCVRLFKIVWHISVQYMSDDMLRAKGYNTDLSGFPDEFKKFGNPFDWYEKSGLRTSKSVLAHEMEHVRQYRSTSERGIELAKIIYLKKESCFDSFNSAQQWLKLVEVKNGHLSGGRFKLLANI